MHHHDQNRLVNYYINQAGHGAQLPGFMGGPTMYGHGIAGFFSKIFRYVMPFARKTYEIAKPHLKSAARDLTKHAITKIMDSSLTDSRQQQEGSGLNVLARLPLKRPPGDRVSHKRRATNKRAAASKRKRRKIQRDDIF